MTDRIDTAKERKKLAALDGHTSGPWWTDAQYSGQQMGCSIVAANPHAGPMPGNPTRGQVAFATAVLNTEARKCESNSRLIAAAPDLLVTVHRLLDALDAKEAENERLRALMRRAHALMRECGWQMAPAADQVSADGVLEAAVAEIEAEFSAALNPEGES